MAFGTDIPAIQAHICVRGGLEAIAFYEKALAAENTYHQLAEDGRRVLHANLAIYGGEVMLHDEFPEHDMSVASPSTLGSTTFALNVNLKAPADVDAAFARATQAGATSLMEPGDMFWGSRYARIRDPYGHVWAFNAALEG
jgi:PhnB protein